MLLELAGVSKRFGNLHAVKDLSLSVPAGQIRGVIGPNGSGKSTLFNLISGIYAPEPGASIVFDGHDIAGREPHEIAGLGIARTFQLLRVFGGMTVIENLLIGRHAHLQHKGLAAFFGLPGVRSEERRQRAEMMELLSYVGLADHADMPAAALSIGQRRLLALGRAIAMKPKLLLLDEPGAGLSPVNVDALLRTIVDLQRKFNLTIIIVEHILKLIMDICQEVTVLDHGLKIAEGPPARVRDDHKVIEAYLGREMDDDAVRAYFAGAEA